MIATDATADAYMDPWCVVSVITGERLLFGFAVRHPATGGLSWVRSTPIRHLDEVTGCAITESGRPYALGRRIEPEKVPLEGEEAWLAFDLLIGADAVGRRSRAIDQRGRFARRRVDRRMQNRPASVRRRAGSRRRTGC